MLDVFQDHPGLWIGTVFLFALLVGSFLNVVILRLPRRLEYEWRREHLDPGEQGKLALEPPPDLVFSRSACPQCGHRIRAVENIPLLSYLLLKGKCSACGTPISVQYPLVELLTALASALVAWHFGPSLACAAALALTWALIALSVIDLREQLLPDLITLPMLWLGLLLNAFGVYTDPASAIIGAASGYLTLWCVYQVFKLATGKEGMGYGDFKLLALFGGWLGWQLLPLVLLLSSLVGALVGIGLIIFGGRDRNIPIPFGPYIAAAGWIALLWGGRIIETYLDVSGLG